HDLGNALGSGSTEHHEVDQRVGTQTVGTVDRHASCFAHGEQARDDRIRVAVLQSDDFAVVVRLDAAHVVVHGRHHGDRLLAQVNAGEDLRGLSDARQTLGQDFRRDVVKVQVDV